MSEIEMMVIDLHKAKGRVKKMTNVICVRDILH